MDREVKRISGWRELKVLFICADAAMAAEVKCLMQRLRHVAVETIQVAQLTKALRLLPNLAIDAVLYFISLEFRRGLQDLPRIKTTAPHLPLVVLGRPARARHMLAALQQGAQEYLAVEQLAEAPLLRTILMAICRTHRTNSTGGQAKMESLSILAGGLAHHYNNLLVGILGNADLILHELPENSPAWQMARQIASSAMRAANITDRMLSFTGKGNPAFSRMDITSLLKKRLNLYRAFLRHKIAFELNLSSELPLINTAPAEINRLLRNTVLNAMEAIGERDGLIRVSTGVQLVKAQRLGAYLWPAEMAPGKYVYIDIADNGRGIREIDRSKVFDPFFTTKSPGRGLGLAEVWGIIKSHRGAIQLQSAPDGGTRLTLLVPCLRQARCQRPGVARAATDPQRNATLLVVDRDEAGRQFAKDTLAQNGFHVLLAENGAACLQLHREYSERISLVLLDTDLADMSGKEVLRELRRRNPAIRVVFCSRTAPVSALKADPRFIQKPCTGRVLVERVRLALAE